MNPRCRTLKLTEDVRKYATGQGIAEEEALKKGMEAKSKEFQEKVSRKGCGTLRKGIESAHGNACSRPSGNRHSRTSF
ncbi:MAG: hypothetical protein IH623_07685 [Verrucomicrobia bacterium]|nr:hypothetical protein [Verrucomicrobiota bacterium]